MDDEVQEGDVSWEAQLDKKDARSIEASPQQHERDQDGGYTYPLPSEPRLPMEVANADKNSPEAWHAAEADSRS